MTTKRTASRRAPARKAPVAAKVAATERVANLTPARLVFSGGADLGFRDKSGKRRVLRGVPFTTDPSTAAWLLATDPSVTKFVEPGVVEVLTVDRADQDYSEPEIPEEQAPETPEPTEAPIDTGGPIVLGDLPPSARLTG